MSWCLQNKMCPRVLFWVHCSVTIMCLTLVRANLRIFIAHMQLTSFFVMKNKRILNDAQENISMIWFWFWQVRFSVKKWTNFRNSAKRVPLSVAHKNVTTLLFNIKHKNSEQRCSNFHSTAVCIHKINFWNCWHLEQLFR